MKIVLFSIVLVLAGCAAKQPVSSLKTDIVHSDTMEIIRSAAESAPSGVQGDFILEIKKHCKVSIEEFVTAKEDITFKLPSSLN